MGRRDREMVLKSACGCCAGNVAKREGAKEGSGQGRWAEMHQGA